MEWITLKQFAKMHGMSIYSAIKMVQRGDLESRSEIVDGVKVTYVKSNDSDNKSAATDNKRIEHKDNMLESSKSETQRLIEEISLLRDEISLLRSAIERIIT
ncbi:MAG: hypothetical protein L3J42_06635 [Hydrogenimonas sp.]|nr:hypothetical protein [Hydrogenimonas sp.]